MKHSSASSNIIKLRDGRFLAYREGGVSKEEAKHKIILVHGFNCSKDLCFSASKEVMEELGVYFVFHDRSGYGESDLNMKRSLQSEVDDIAELADQLELGSKFYLVGFSMGAYPIWGCLKLIPHRLSGVALVSPAVNYQWPSLPEKLIKKDYRRVIIKLSLWIWEHAPGRINWSVIQKLIVSAMLVYKTAAFYFSRHEMDVFKRPNYFSMLREKVIFETLRSDFVACYERWDFEPADLTISQENSVHIWQGNKDMIVPVQLQRSILQKQPFINYHEISDGGHLIWDYNGTCDAILRSLLLGEEQKIILNSPFDGNMYLFWGFMLLLMLFLGSSICSYFFH